MAKKKIPIDQHNLPAFTHIPTKESDAEIVAGTQGNRAHVQEFIHRRRRQIIVHSIIYYRFDENIVSDDTWQTWADELAAVQNQYPEFCAIGFYDNDFKDWTGATGHDLDLHTLAHVALALLNSHKERII